MLEGGSGFPNYWLNVEGDHMVSWMKLMAMNEICIIVHSKIPHCVSWTYIHQSVFSLLHRSLFLKVHSHGTSILSHLVQWVVAEYMLLHLGDAHCMTQMHQTMINPNWLIQQCWSSVSRAHIIGTMYWVVFADNKAIDVNGHAFGLTCIWVQLIA